MRRRAGYDPGDSVPAGNAMINVVLIDRNGRPEVPLPETTPCVSEACADVRRHYERHGFHAPWCAYLAIRDGRVVGVCGFRGPPDAHEQVIIAYRTFPGFEGEGLATAMAEALVGIARDHNPVMTVIAHSWRAENAATRILRHLGFECLGDDEDPYYGECWSWRLLPGARPG